MPASPQLAALSGSSNLFYVDLPPHEGAAWQVRWQRCAVATAAGLPTHDDNGPAAKRPRLAVSDDAWLRDPRAEDPLETAYTALQAELASDETAKFGIGRCLATIIITRSEEILERQLWIFHLVSRDTHNIPSGLAELDSGTFDFRTLYPPSANMTHISSTDATTSTAYAAFLTAAHEAVVGSFHRQLAHRPQLHVTACGNGLHLASSAEDDPTSNIWCQPRTFLRQQGLVISLAARPTSYHRLRAQTIREGTRIILAPLGLPAIMVRTASSAPAPFAMAFGVPPGMPFVVARVKLGAADEEVAWPMSLCLVDGKDSGQGKAGVGDLRPSLTRDRARHRADIEDTAISASAYIDAVAKERDRERRERAAASVKTAFPTAGTPGSNMGSTPAAFPDDAARTPVTVQTPGSATQPGFDFGALSVTNSPVTSRFARSLGPDAAPPPAAPAPATMEIDETPTIDWGWPLPAGNFEDLGGDNFDAMLGLSEADFSFFDDAPQGGQGPPPSAPLAPPTPSFDFAASPRYTGSPQFPPTALNAPTSVSMSGPSPSTPGGGNEGKTPFTPFATTVDTDQTDPAIGPSPYSPALNGLPAPPHVLLHLPPYTEAGFGAVDFDEDGGGAGEGTAGSEMSPPAYTIGTKRKRPRSSSQSLRHGYGSKLRQASLPSTLRPSGPPPPALAKGDCICPPRWRPIVPMQVGDSPSAPGFDTLSPALRLMQVDDADPEDDTEDDGDDRELRGVGVEAEEADEVDKVPPLPVLGPSLLRLHRSGAAAVVEVANVDDTKAIKPKRPVLSDVDRFRFEQQAHIVAESMLSVQSESPLVLSSDLSLAVTRFASSSPQALAPASVQLERVMLPQVRCLRRDTVLDLDLAAVPLWTKLDLAPLAASKNAQAYIVVIDAEGQPEMDAAALRTCLVRMTELYELLGMGSLHAGDLSYGCDAPGVCRLPLATVCNETTLTALRDLGKRISQAGAQAMRQTLYLVVTPSPFAASVYAETVSTLQLFGPRPLLQPLSATTAGELDVLFSPACLDTAKFDRSTQILFAAHDRLSAVGTRMRLSPAGMIDARWPDARAAFAAPTLPLSFPLDAPAPPRFDFKWPSAHLHTLERDRVLHVAYGTSADRAWLGVAIMDDRGEEQSFRTYYLGDVPNEASEPDQRGRSSKVAENVVKLALDKAHCVKVEWSIAIWRLGTPRSDETQAFAAAFEAALRVAKTPMDLTLGVVQLPTEVSLAISVRDERRPGDLLVRYSDHAHPLDTSPSPSIPLVSGLSPFRIMSRISSTTFSATLHPQYHLHLLHRAAPPLSTRSNDLDLGHLRRLSESIGRLAYLRAATQSASPALPWLLAVVRLLVDEVVDVLVPAPASQLALTMPLPTPSALMTPLPVATPA